MKTKSLSLGLLALTLLTGCGFSLDSLLSGSTSGKTPTAEPTPTALATPRPTFTPTPITTAVPTSPIAQPSATGTAVVPSTGDLLLYLDMETAPVSYRYKGDLVETKGATAFAAGRLGAAWQFDGQGSYVQIPLDINPDKYPALTFTAWARYDGLESGGPFQVISHDDGGYDRSLGIDSRGAEGVGWSTFAGSAAVLGSMPIKAGEWVFLASVYDQTSKTTTLYVNGLRKVAENAEMGTGHPHLRIGSNPSFGEHFTGLIDEVRVYGRALSTAEIAGLHGQTPVPPVLPSPVASPVKFFDNGNIQAVYNGATCAPTITTTQDYLLTEIYNYHWNDASGQAPPGQIGLKSNTGVVYGPWEVSTRDGQGGVPHAYWFANPKVLIPAGTYTVTDSHPQSWSYNAASGCSISWLTGIPQ